METIQNINNTFGPGTANENTVRWWLKKFCKVYKRLEDEPWRMVTGHQKLTTTNWEPSLKLILLCLEKLLKNSKVDHSMVIWHLKQIGKLKKLNKWAPHELMEKKSLFWSVIFSYSTQQWTISWLDCDVWQKVNFIWWPVMTSSVAGLRRSSKAVPKAKLVPKKIIAPVWLSVAHLIHYTLWIPVKPLHLRRMLSKSMRCTENCNACIWYW